MSIKVVAFDTFGTVFDLSGVSHQEIKDYAHHIRKLEWSPLHLPQSWESLPAHPDSVEGIAELRKDFIVVTCSNGPLGLLTKLSKHNGISWDAIIPLEMNKVFKPNGKAYLTVCEILGILPEEMMMVSANKDFGDIENSRSVGCWSVLIRHQGEGPKDIIELAKVMKERK